jgi:hypothetical protein
MAEASFNVPFIPQEGITNQILTAMHQANQEHADQQAAAARQKQLGIAQQEANTASQRLAIETPLIGAQVQNYANEAQRQAYTLASQKRIDDMIAGNGPLSEQHILGIVGDHHYPGVPLEPPTVSAPPASTPVAPIAPDQLNISDPTGQNLSSPAAPISSTQSGQTLASSPAQPSAPVGGIPGMLAEVQRRVHGFTDTEADNINFAYEQLLLNRTPDGVAKFSSDVQKIVAQRSQPEYATQIAFMRQGYSEPQAIQMAKRNTAIDAELTKIESSPEVLSGDKAAIAKGQLSDLAQSQGLTAVNRERAQRLVSVATVAEKNQLAFDAAKQRAEQAAKEGDPNAAAKLLTSGMVAPSQLISTRNPDFATKAFTAAQKMDPTFNLQKAEADFKAASSPANLNFFGPAHSIIDSGGTLDQLAEIAKRIPASQIPALNSLADWQKAKLGDGPMAQYAATALGLADDYSKITGGGGSIDARNAASGLIPPNASPEARAGAMKAIRGTVTSQINSRVGNNRVLQAQYGVGEGGASSTPTSGSLSSGASSYLTSIGVSH